MLLSAGRKPEGYAQFYELATRLLQDTLHLKELASFYLDDKNYAQARATYGQILERAPGDTDAFVGMGQAYAEDGRFPQARDAYRAAIVSAPRRELAYLLLAQLYINDGETDAEAIATLEELLKALPGSQTGRDQLIERYIRAKRDDDAKREIGKLVLQKGDPNRNRYRLALGNLLMVREKWTEAVTEFERIDDEEPGNPVAILALAGAYIKAGRATDAAIAYEKAAVAAESALRQNSRDQDVRNALIQARTAQKNPGAATDFLNVMEAVSGSVPLPKGK
ncbi:MAG: tetratricopeptide repeat protein [Armatimonadetes bacterium]|nr:tetratricopeptide repeat protein [Armatimonadota bacterium]